MREIVLLNSGGLDSALMARKLFSDNWYVRSLHISAGAVGAQSAMVSAEITAEKYCATHHLFLLDLGYEPDHYDTIHGETVSYRHAQEQGIPDGAHLLPGPRNLPILALSLGVSYAKQIEVCFVCTGFSTPRHKGITDCLNKASVYGRGFCIIPQIIAPYGYMKTNDAIKFCNYKKDDFYWITNQCSGCDNLDKIEV